VITPPYQVPDEWSHYLRAEAIAQGHLQPRMTWQGDCASFAVGIERFVRATYRTEGAFTVDEIRRAAAIPREGGGTSTLCFSSWYTPLSYVPQTLVAKVGQMTNARPFTTFYAGRVANFLVALIVLLAAMRIAPAHRNVMAAVALLPMSMYQLASWSADVPTFAAAVLLTALLLRAMERDTAMSMREGISIAAMSTILALCKPVYFLIAALVAAIPARRFRSVRERVGLIAIVFVAIAIGVGGSVATARQARFNARINLPVDAREQARCLAADPLRFATVAFNDLRANGSAYVEEMVGRLGMMNVKLPAVIVWIEIVLLILIGLAGPRPPIAQRAIAMLIIAITVGGVLLSQYLVWSIICGPGIEGVQGRYFLPILPLALVSAGAGLRLRQSVQTIAIAAVAIIANAVSLTVLLERYW
ncbi:MAG: DUF2142 domain-containing protein, partial [Thermoanaerobaculia bacterium]